MAFLPRRPHLAIRAMVLLGLIGWGVSRASAEAPTAGAEQGLSSPPPVDREGLPEGRVLVEICERGIPAEKAWPAAPSGATERYEAEAFGFSRVPHKYIDTGLRADRANPFLLRAMARVNLPAGTHRLVLRGRGASRLFIDDRLLLSTPFPPPITDGHTPIPSDYLDLGPDFRFAPPGNREAWTTFTTPGREHLVILESIVGGSIGKGALRPELGETVVALSPEGSETFYLLAPRRVVPYTDEGWKAYSEIEADAIARLEADRRADAFRRHADDWEGRRRIAERWLASTPGPKVPEAIPSYPANNDIDRFLSEALAKASASPTSTRGTVDFARDVRPIFEAKCFACHQGRKVRGKLRLDTSEGALAGGASGEPAVVPGRPDESQLLSRVLAEDEAEAMPPKGERLTAAEVGLLRRWIEEGAAWSSSTSRRRITPTADDLTFLRRVTLDTVGVVSTEAEVRAFLDDDRPDKRARVIDRLLADPRWADHWVGYWQDVLAENPNILNPTLNNSGPFRWWIYEALLDNKPIDLFVTELVGMGGSLHLGGPAGFSMASENDVPMAEKAVILGSAFLGVQMKCARCHDAPAHESTQEDLFQLAALLGEGPITVPKTSSVPGDKLHAEGRKPLIRVTLQPGTAVAPAWPFPEFVQAGPDPDTIPTDASRSSRGRLAALITAPQNERFAQVIANRVWARLMGRGLVEPVDDWEKGAPTHPELLRYLGRELVRGGYDLKHLARLILNTHAYQRAADPELSAPDPLYAAPARRRLDAEQIVDSLFLAAGKPMETEEINLDLDGGRAINRSISLGRPRRAWQFASTSNERDRPSLALPRVQTVVDALSAFGWRASRQDSRTSRDVAPDLLQPTILANGTMGIWLTRLSEDHEVTRLALEDQPLEALVDRLFLRVLTRYPSPEEREPILDALREGYADRVTAPGPKVEERPRPLPKYVSWSNHLTEEANEIKRQRAAEARRGDPPTQRLSAPWRERLEDVLWALLNAPEFLFTP